MKKTTWVWIIIIVLAALLVWGVLTYKKDPGTDTNTNPQVTENRIAVSDQPAGTLSMTIGTADLKEPGFIAIHESTNGSIGKIIATSAYLPAGEHRNLTILTSALIDGAAYVAMLHRDNGDQRFDATTDLPAKDANGNTVMAEFIMSGDILGEQKG